MSAALPGCGGKAEVATPISAPGGVSPTLQGVLSTIEAQMATCSIPGGSIAIVQNGKLTESAGFGWKDTGGGVVEASTLFQTAALSKVVTAVATLRLAEQGKVDLSSPVTAYVPLTLAPGFDPSAITVADLLASTSGLPDFETEDTSCAVGPGQIGAWFAASGPQPLWAPPGAVWDYSQRGFAAAGWVVENASGQRFEDAVAARVFEPAGMTTATYEPSVVLSGDNYAWGHEIDPSGSSSTGIPPGDFDCAANRPPDGVYASVLDYAHLAETLLAGGGAMLTSASVKTLQTGQVVDDVYPGETYGYGLYHHEGYKGLHLLRVSGDLHGFDAALVLDPEHDFAVVLFYDGHNTSSACSIMNTAEGAVSAYLGLDGVPGPIWTTPASAWAQFEGTYVDPNDALGTITVKVDGSNLVATSPGYGAVTLTNVSATAFTGNFGGVLGGPIETVTFAPGPSGPASWFVTRLGVGRRQ
jgi:CubicO group peptidase (beta-lactamase class C family)